MYKRTIEDEIKKRCFTGKLIVVYGPRQVGKTTLVRKIIEESGQTSRFFSGDDLATRELLSVPSQETLKKAFSGVKYVLVDEAQKIPNIGTTLKLAYDFDYLKETQIIATGSSSFDLKNRLAEAMTGRYWGFTLYPLSIEEISGNKDNMYYEMKVNGKENFILKYGLYPGTFYKDENFVHEQLKSIVESTLYKDVFVMEGIKKPEVLVKLVKVLAINISQTVTISGLAKLVGTTNITIERYLDLLEKTFVIKRLYSFSRNLNNELKRAIKIYFVDIGFRNAVLNEFRDYDYRADIGFVFENFWVMERIKWAEYNYHFCNKYFWQTYNDVEIDYLEEYNGELHAYECKWTDRKSKGVKLFEEEYKKEKASVKTISKDNYLDFLK